MAISKQEENIVRNWVYEIRNDRQTFPHGVPFEDTLKIIEKLLDTQWASAVQIEDDHTVKRKK